MLQLRLPKKYPDWFRLSYPQKQNLPWNHRKAEVLVFGLILLSLLFLIPLSYALQGYETITVLNPNYFDVPWHWYYHFTKKPAPGKLCDPFYLQIGEAFVTNFGLFTWTLAQLVEHGPNGATLSPSNMQYLASSLNTCDVAYLSVQADSRTKSVTTGAQILCLNPDGVLWAAGTSATVGLTNPTTGGFGLEVGTIGVDAITLLYYASIDALENMDDWQVATPTTAPYFVANNVGLATSLCPANRTGWVNAGGAGVLANSSCLTEPPTLPAQPFLLSASGAGVNTTQDQLQAYETASVTLMQLMLALVRVDIGHTLSNNLLINSTVANMLVPQAYSVSGVASNTRPSQLYGAINGDNHLPHGAIDFTSDFASSNHTYSEEAQLELQYTCHFQRPKTVMSIIISTAVATITFLTSGWGIAILVLSYMAERDRRKAAEEAEKQQAGDHNAPETPDVEKGPPEKASAELNGGAQSLEHHD